jgi:hypothetical protein
MQSKRAASKSNATCDRFHLPRHYVATLRRTRDVECAVQFSLLRALVARFIYLFTGLISQLLLAPIKTPIIKNYLSLYAARKYLRCASCARNVNYVGGKLKATQRPRLIATRDVAPMRIIDGLNEIISHQMFGRTVESYSHALQRRSNRLLIAW